MLRRASDGTNEVISQILWGSAVLGLCSLLHVALLVLAIRLLQHMAQWNRPANTTLRAGVLLGGALALIVFSHSAQVWIWAVSFVLIGALPDLAGAIYFALVTYTTLGYGDVTLAADVRIYAAMAAVSGLLSFGLSTAFVVSLFAKLLPADHAP